MLVAAMERESYTERSTLLTTNNDDDKDDDDYDNDGEIRWSFGSALSLLSYDCGFALAQNTPYIDHGQVKDSEIGVI